MNEVNRMLRSLPAVEAVLQDPALRAALPQAPKWLLLDAVHDVLERTRERILAGEVSAGEEVSVSALLPRIRECAERLQRPHFRRVINATGVVIHTNLGRSLLSEQTLAHVRETAAHYSNLEYDLDAGRRGSRYSHVEGLLCRLCGCESALVVNNNAAAVFLSLNTLAEGREVIVSRGQLVEIGGSFRVPDVIRKSGCTLVEVGTTNKTHPRDYREAVGERTACLLKVHMSNFEMRGFVREVSVPELAAIGREFQIPVVEDLGSGSVIDLSPYGLRREPTAREALKQGADVVTFSGDKLLGGPQAGILVGRREILDRIKKNPLTRALRVDKLTLSALEATLRELLDPERAVTRIPTLRMLTVSTAELKSRAEKLAALIRRAAGQTLETEVFEDVSQVGGGALPENSLPTFVVSLAAAGVSVNSLEARFRASEPPVIGRIHKERFLLDVRTIQDHELEEIVRAAAGGWEWESGS